ncbi:MAG: NADH-quinone oxidoreductase subunit NuoE family protein [Candidatus Latescibacterota bacterium]
MESENVQQIIDRHNGNHGGIIAILHEIQTKFGYLPEKELRAVSEKTGHSLVDIYSVATFYKSFSLKPKGKHHISLCMGTACHVRESPHILEEFERELKVKAGETTPDGEFSMETVNCLGACALGPIVVVDGQYFSNVSRKNVKEILRKTSAGLDAVQVANDPRIFQVDVSCPYCNHSLMDDKHLVDEHPSIKMTASFAGEHGWLRLSSMHGSYRYESEFDIPLNTVINFFCPHCNAELSRGVNCTDCGAPMVPMIVRKGGMAQICSRRGCRNHMLDVSGVNF